MSDIPEKDWKIVRSMKDDVLDLACRRIMEKLTKIIADEEKSAHARYLELWEAIQEEDRDIGLMFNDLKRSSAILQLARWRYNGLISDDELESFTPETIERVKAFQEIWRD